MSSHIEQFIQGYKSALYFVDTGDMDEPPTYLILSDDALEEIRETCEKFWVYCGQHILNATCTHRLETKIFRAGFDFYLTRNGHGAGFWDGDWSEPEATKLTEASESFGESGYLYTDETGTISIG